MADSGKCTEDMLRQMAAQINKNHNKIQYSTEILKIQNS